MDHDILHMRLTIWLTIATLCAVIVLRPGAQLLEADIRAFCAGQIAHYKIPRYVRFVAQFPMTVTGKVQKYLLREQIARELGMAE